MTFMLFFRLACWLSGAEISSRNLEHPLNGKTFSDGGRTRFGMKVQCCGMAILWSNSKSNSGSHGRPSQKCHLCFFLDWHFSYWVLKSQAEILNTL